MTTFQRIPTNFPFFASRKEWPSYISDEAIYTNLPKVFVQHKITLVVNVPLWTNIKSGAMMGIEIYKYRKHTVLALSLVKI